jgi:hypothetical protein
MMLIGRSSVVMKRVFVVSLALVSLAVWAITVLALGGLRSDSAMLSDGAVHGPASVPSVRPPVGVATPEAGIAMVSQKSVAPAVTWPEPASPLTSRIRNPFLPDAEVFPVVLAAVKDVEAGAVFQAEAATLRGPTEDELRQAEESARAMVLIGTLDGGNDPRAVIDGVTCRVGETVGLLRVAHIGRGTATVELGGRRYELRVPQLEGTLMGGKAPLAMIDGRGYEAGQYLVNIVAEGASGKVPVTTSVRIKEIRAQSVVLAVGDVDFELGMGASRESARDRRR